MLKCPDDHKTELAAPKRRTRAEVQQLVAVCGPLVNKSRSGDQRANLYKGDGVWADIRLTGVMR